MWLFWLVLKGEIYLSVLTNLKFIVNCENNVKSQKHVVQFLHVLFRTIILFTRSGCSQWYCYLWRCLCMGHSVCTSSQFGHQPNPLYIFFTQYHWGKYSAFDTPSISHTMLCHIGVSIYVICYYTKNRPITFLLKEMVGWV